MDANEQPFPRLHINKQEMRATFEYASPDRPWSAEDVPLLESLGFVVVTPHRWGLRELHPPSFGVGFLLSSLFWLTIGIALQIISR